MNTLPTGKMTGFLELIGAPSIIATVTIDGTEHDIVIPLTEWQKEYLRARLDLQPEPPQFRAARLRDSDEFVRLRPATPPQDGADSHGE